MGRVRTRERTLPTAPRVVDNATGRVRTRERALLAATRVIKNAIEGEERTE
jgi:hypothetical protein